MQVPEKQLGWAQWGVGGASGEPAGLRWVRETEAGPVGTQGGPDGGQHHSGHLARLADRGRGPSGRRPEERVCTHGSGSSRDPGAWSTRPRRLGVASRRVSAVHCLPQTRPPFPPARTVPLLPRVSPNVPPPDPGHRAQLEKRVWRWKERRQRLGLGTFPLCTSCSDKPRVLVKGGAAHWRGPMSAPSGGVPDSPPPSLGEEPPSILSLKDPPTMVSLLPWGSPPPSCEATAAPRPRCPRPAPPELRPRSGGLSLGCTLSPRGGGGLGERWRGCPGPSQGLPASLVAAPPLESQSLAQPPCAQASWDPNLLAPCLVTAPHASPSL